MLVRLTPFIGRGQGHEERRNEGQRLAFRSTDDRIVSRVLDTVPASHPRRGR